MSPPLLNPFRAKHPQVRRGFKRAKEGRPRAVAGVALDVVVAAPIKVHEVCSKVIAPVDHREPWAEANGAVEGMGWNFKLVQVRLVNQEQFRANVLAQRMVCRTTGTLHVVAKPERLAETRDWEQRPWPTSRLGSCGRRNSLVTGKMNRQCRSKCNSRPLIFDKVPLCSIRKLQMKTRSHI